MPGRVDRPARSAAARRLGSQPVRRTRRRGSLSAVQRTRVQVAGGQTAGSARLTVARKSTQAFGQLPHLRRTRSIRPISRGSATSSEPLPAENGSHLRCSATSLGASGQSGTGIGFAATALAHEPVRDALRAVFDGDSSTGAYDAKRLLRVLRDGGVANARFTDDAMIGAHLLDPSAGLPTSKTRRRCF